MTEEELIKLKIQLAEDMREKALVSKVERGMYEVQRAKEQGLIWNGTTYDNQ